MPARKNDHVSRPVSANETEILRRIVQVTAELFEFIPDTVFFAKDRSGRYLAVNQSLVERCGLRAKEDVIGRTASNLFPKDLGVRYSRQDEEVIATGYAVTN